MTKSPVSADWVTFTEEILNGKLFLCSKVDSTVCYNKDLCTPPLA